MKLDNKKPVTLNIQEAVVVQLKEGFTENDRSKCDNFQEMTENNQVYYWCNSNLHYRKYHY